VAIAVPGFTPLPGRARRERVRLRRAFELPGDVSIPTLAIDLGSRHGRTAVWLNGTKLGVSDDNGAFVRAAPLPLRPGANELLVELDYPRFAGGVRWVGEPALGTSALQRRGHLVQRYESGTDGAERRLSLLVPRCADLTQPLPLVVALPGWGGNVHSYAHSALARGCERRSWLLLVPDTGGNRLYTGAAEQAVLEAIALVRRSLSVDPSRIYLTGASMGGAGALQIGYHYPDRFAAVAAFYGDSHYDLRTGYIRRILRTRERALRYSVLEFAANSRNLPVVLIHARDDKVSPVKQSLALHEAHERLALVDHHLRAPLAGGHTLALVDRFAEEVLEFFAQRRRQESPTRVSFRSNSRRYEGAYWASLELRREGHFGELDLSVDSNARSLRVHTVDRGLTEVVVDLDAAGVGVDRGLAVQVERSMGAPIVLRSTTMPPSLVLLSEPDGRDLGSLAARGGRVSLGRLRRGGYRILPR